MQLAVRRLACLYFVYKSLVHSVQAGAGAERGCCLSVYGICGGPPGGAGARAWLSAVQSAARRARRRRSMEGENGGSALAGGQPRQTTAISTCPAGGRVGSSARRGGPGDRRRGDPGGPGDRESGRPRGDVARTSDSPHGRQGQSSVLSGKIGHWPSGGSSYQLRK